MKLKIRGVIERLRYEVPKESPFRKKGSNNLGVFLHAVAFVCGGCGTRYQALSYSFNKKIIGGHNYFIKD